MATRKRTAIPNSEWEVTIQLRAGDDNACIGDPIVMHFADSYAKECPENIDWLIGRRIEEAVPRLRKLAPKGKRVKREKQGA